MDQLTPEFYQHVAISTVLIIVFALVLGLRNSRKKRSSESAQWTAHDYYTYLQACIISCATLDQLDKLKPLVEKYYDRQFRVSISVADRKRYYSRLLKGLADKENRLKSLKAVSPSM